MKRAGKKLALLAMLAAVGASVSGYFMGLRQAIRPPDGPPLWSSSAEDGMSEHVSAPTAPSYEMLAQRLHHRNAGWGTRLADLTPAPPAHEAPAPLSDEARAALHEQRATSRAFDGAPPTVPHPIDQRHAASCLACHGQPTVIGATLVAQISHPTYSQCLQCHAASGPGPGWTSPARPPALRLPDNDFTGAPAAAPIARAHPDAPPVIPHPLWMRENCMSCHGAGGSSAIKPDHGGRQSCLQCHATQATFDQQPLAAQPHPCPDTQANLPAALLAAIAALEP